MNEEKIEAIFAVDPGPIESAFVEWNGSCIIRHGTLFNHLLLPVKKDRFALEMIASYGMPVGKDIFDTCVWIGRFIQAWDGADLVYRREVKLHLCEDSRAKDSNVRQALIDRFGRSGTKKNPGITYGITGDQWQALALAVTWWDRQG